MPVEMLLRVIDSEEKNQRTKALSVPYKLQFFVSGVPPEYGSFYLF